VRILPEARSKEFRDEFTDFTRMEKEGKAGSYTGVNNKKLRDLLESSVPAQRLMSGRTS